MKEVLSGMSAPQPSLYKGIAAVSTPDEVLFFCLDHAGLTGYAGTDGVAELVSLVFKSRRNHVRCQ